MTNRAGGVEAGISTGQPLVMRVAMKALSSLPRPLKTVHLDTHEPDVAITQRSDACAVPRAGVVLEHVVAYELADALLEKTGGRSRGRGAAQPDRVPRRGGAPVTPTSPPTPRRDVDPA
jgi:chorismate synthase